MSFNRPYDCEVNRSACAYNVNKTYHLRRVNGCDTKFGLIQKPGDDTCDWFNTSASTSATRKGDEQRLVAFGFAGPCVQCPCGIIEWA